MRLVITDVPNLIKEDKDTMVITDNGKIHNCIGCFGCWIKTPGKCVILDGYEDTGIKMSRCSEVIIISRCVYGGFSPFVKNVLDRAISYAHPYFVVRNKEMHHKRRYSNVISFSAFLYGDITEAEKETARKLLKANTINFDGNIKNISFYSSKEKLGEAII